MRRSSRSENGMTKRRLSWVIGAALFAVLCVFLVPYLVGNGDELANGVATLGLIALIVAGVALLLGVVQGAQWLVRRIRG